LENRREEQYMYRIVWQYAPEELDRRGAMGVRSSTEAAAEAPLIFKDLSLLTPVEQVFPDPAESLRAESVRAVNHLSEEPLLDLAGYAQTFVAERRGAETLRDRLLGDHRVLAAEIQEPLREANLPAGPGPAGARATPPTPNFRMKQGYLEAAPGGIDAGAAWAVQGGRGSGVRLVDVERGWNLAHEDLNGRGIQVIHGAPGVRDHGTCVLGVVGAMSNHVGVEGIAPDATLMAASIEEREAPGVKGLFKWNAAAAIHVAGGYLGEGDVLLIEVEGRGPRSTGGGSEGWVPIEYWRAEQAAVAHLTRRGVYVVEAAGNGSEDLDRRAYRSSLRRSDFDSLAILVGAGASPRSGVPRSRLSFSNYGSRLDLQGWGEEIATTGGRTRSDLQWDSDPSRCYTATFGGTSGAAAIVAGAVLCLAGAIKASRPKPLKPAEMRELLVETGSPQEESPFERARRRSIGPLPDLGAALKKLRLKN
jgi:subtilisin family serine protease